MKEIVQRLKTYLDHKSLGVTDLSVVLGYNSPQKLYRLFNTENASPSCRIIEDISGKFYDLNLNWLFSGRGNMIIEPQEQADYKEKYYRCLEEKEGLYKTIFKKRK